MNDGRPSEWLDGLRNGDEDSARRIFEHYSHQLCRLAQRHLTSRLRQRVDSEDVVQSVFRTFFHRDSQGQFKIDHSDELWRLLVTITVRKARGIWRKNSSAGRSYTRDQSLDDVALASVFSTQPSVVDALVLADEIESILSGLGPEHTRALEMRLAGLNPTDAASEMGISRQAFYRLLEPLRARLLERDSDRGETKSASPLQQQDPSSTEDSLS